jgi:hypothetical protein
MAAKRLLDAKHRTGRSHALSPLVWRRRALI